jgi:predicted lipoprotein with Yx(FWY)xxD motif
MAWLRAGGTEIRVVRQRRAKASLLVLATTGLVATGGWVGTAAQASVRSSSATTTPVEVKMATVPKLGKILVTGAGLALYYDTANKPGKWACTGTCLTYWPALTLAKGQKAAMAGPGVSGLGTVKGPSGAQVTWKGKPLYTYAADKKGKVTGQGFQHIWFVAQPSKAATTGSATPTTASGSWA